MESTWLSAGGIKKTLKLRFVEIRKHLRTCVQEHGDHCNTPVVISNPSFEIFLIDIQRMCLVKKPIAECGYIALSYVWGGVKQYEHTKERTASLLKENSFREIIDQIPRTIRDCIDMVRQLRGYFLWVDALCIVQDDAETKHIHISRMADIYRSAFLTIAAADAVNANSSLPCNYPYDLTLSPSQTAPGESPKLSSELRSTKYVSRAWTFQERYLSARCLYTFRNHVFIRCSSGVWSRGFSINGWSPRSNSTTHEHILSTEIDILDSRSIMQIQGKDIKDHLSPHLKLLPFAQWSLRTGQPDDEERCLLRCNNTTATWALITMLYTRKSLSFSSDVSNAFSGIAERLEEMTGGNVIHGIPTTLLPHALLWASFLPHWQIERRETSTPLPSWSWMAWDGPVEFPLYMRAAMMFANQEVPKIENFHKSIFSPQIFLPNYNWQSIPSHPSEFNESSDPLIEEFAQVSGGLLGFVSFTVPLTIAEWSDHAGKVLKYKPRVSAQWHPDSHLYVYLFGIDETSSSSGGILFGVNRKDLQQYCWRTLVELVLVTESRSGDGLFVNFIIVHWLNGYAERFGIGQAHVSAWQSWSPEEKTIILG